MTKKHVSSIIKGASWTVNFVAQLIEQLEKLGISDKDIFKLGQTTKESNDLIVLCAKKIAEEIRHYNTGYLTPINHEKIIIGECNGKTDIIDSANVFGKISDLFKEWHLSGFGLKTKKTEVKIYEMSSKNGNFRNIYSSENAKIHELCLTQHQIIKFVENNDFWIRRSPFGTFFLTKTKGKSKILKHNFFVIRIQSRPSGGHIVTPISFDDPVVLIGENRSQFVIPQ